MNKLILQGIALLLMLAALPLTSIGSTSETLWVSIVGLVALTIGGLTPPVLRFVGSSEESTKE